MATSQKDAQTPAEPLERDRALEVESPQRKSLPGRIFRWIVALAVIAGFAFLWMNRPLASPAKKKRAGRGPIPVAAEQAKKETFPYYLDGLGTVQAFNSVTVRARVDGEIQQIYFQEGQDMKKGDMLAQIDPRTYEAMVGQAKAKLAQDQAQLSNAQASLQRNEALFKNRVVDQQTYDAQRFTAAQLLALTQADQAALDDAQTQLAYTKITAPIDGRAGIRLVDAGNIVHSGDAGGIVVINQVQPISVVFTLPQQDLKDVREALLTDKQLKVIALDRDNSSTLSEGVLAVLDNQIDPTTASVKLKATFPNQDLKLWPGQFVNVRLLVGEKKDAVTVPAQAIQLGPKGDYVYVINSDDDTVSMQLVKVGQTEGSRTIIQDGVAPGDMVVWDGQYRLQDGTAVEIKGSNAAQPDTTPADQ